MKPIGETWPQIDFTISLPVFEELGPMVSWLKEECGKDWDWTVSQHSHQQASSPSLSIVRFFVKDISKAIMFKTRWG
jgi:hypothetical protein